MINVKGIGWKAFVIVLVVVVSGVSACAPGAVATPVTPPTGIEAVKPTPGAPTPAPTPQPKYGGILRSGTVEMQARWDMHGSGMGSLFVPMAPVFNALIGDSLDDPTGQTLAPDLATGWTVGDDGKTYTFPLQKGVKWHDGKPFTSADVLVSMNKIISPPKEILSARQALFVSVAAVEAPDDYTIVFKLKYPDAAFLEVLSNPWNVIYPKHILDQFGLDVMDKVGIEHKIGTGPFKVKDFRLGEYVKLERNPEYFKKGLPYVDGVELRPFADSSSFTTAFIAGKLDIYQTIATDLSGEDAQVIAQARPTDVTVARVARVGPYALYTNVTKPPWDDIRARQALSEAIDRKVVTDALVEGGSVGALVYPGSKWELPKGELEKMPGYGPDMDARRARAKQLLQEAGFTKDKPLVVNLMVRPSGDSERIGIIIAPMIEAIGAKVNIIPVPAGRQAELRVTGEFEVTVHSLIQSGIDPTHLFGTYLVCKSDRNQSRICVPALDKLVEEQRRTIDFAQRKLIVDQLHKGHLEQSAWIAVTWPNGLGAWYNYVRGFSASPTGYTSRARLERVWLDK